MAKMKRSVLSIIVLSITVLFSLGAVRLLSHNDRQKEAAMKRADKYIELHLHLDGAITVDIAKKLAKLQGITLPTEDDEELLALLSVPDDCDSLNDFLECFAFPLTLLQTKEGITESVRLVLKSLKEQGVLYAEIRFAPQLHTDKGLTQEGAVLAAIDGLKGAAIPGNLILCCMRGEGNEALNYETVETAKKYLVEDGGVVALDLAGAEALYPTENYSGLFALAKEYGIPFTIHAGEAADAKSVRTAIEMGASRIGHGVRIFEDESVAELVREKGVTLEMCPTSNRMTNAVEDMSDYPLQDYLKKGIKVTLNTDDMAIERTTLADEYRYMEKTFGLTPEQETRLLKNAIDAAFTSEATKAELRKAIGVK